MMNRSVMERQMFKYGGPVKKMEQGGASTGQMATFVNPESGERVTLDMANETDVQMMDQLVAAGYVMDTPVKGMQMGGDPMMAPPAGIAALEQAPADPGSMAGMESMGVGEVDPATVEQMLGEVAPSIGDPEQAEDFETMMNSVRGDDATIEERRMELASLVGEEDAMKTPESVLALVQPVVQMSLVDEGIGGLAQQEMQQPVEGDMAGGIMSMMGG